MPDTNNNKDKENRRTYKYNRYSEAIHWFSLKTKINERYDGGPGHFFPRSAIVNVYLGENIGHEQNGYRPAVVVSVDSNNRTNANVAIVPLTKLMNKIKNGKLKLLDSQYILYRSKYPKLKYDSVVICEHIRVVSKARIGDLICFVKPDDMEKIDSKLRFFLDL